MASEDISNRLNEDEFAFYFSGGTGVAADQFGTFLTRSARIARRNGAELKVTTLERGSLAVVLRVTKGSGAAIGREFRKSPVQTAAAGVVIVATVVAALVGEMNAERGKAKPLAKAGAEVVGEGQADRIEIITQTTTVVVMDARRAEKIRGEVARKKRARLLPPNEVLELVEAGRRGELTGEVADVLGEFHFRPDGFRFLVPIHWALDTSRLELFPGMRLAVTADLQTQSGQPDMLVVYKATRE